MPAGPGRARLRKLYPTMDEFEKAVKEAGSQLKLAEQLGVSNATVYYHKQWLTRGRKPIRTKEDVKCRFTNRELDQRVKELFGNKRYAAKTYRLDEMEAINN
jgi:hypothetical protein